MSQNIDNLSNKSGGSTGSSAGDTGDKRDTSTGGGPVGAKTTASTTVDPQGGGGAIAKPAGAASSQGGVTGPYGSGGGQATGAATGLAAQAKEYGQKVADAATTAKDYVSDKVSVVGDKFKDLQNTDFNQVTQDAKAYARENPGQALLISAAAGFLLGLLLRSGRR